MGKFGEWNYKDGFSLVNHGRFTKFSKVFPHQTFLLYGKYINLYALICVPGVELIE